MGGVGEEEEAVGRWRVGWWEEEKVGCERGKEDEVEEEEEEREEEGRKPKKETGKGNAVSAAHFCFVIGFLVPGTRNGVLGKQREEPPRIYFSSLLLLGPLLPSTSSLLPLPLSPLFPPPSFLPPIYPPPLLHLLHLIETCMHG